MLTFSYLYAGHSRKELNVTRRMLLRILTYHQVMPAYLDFLSVFGSQDNPRDLRYSGFREQTFITRGTVPRGPAVPVLGRSGRQYQLCYNLKAVASTSLPNTPVKNKTWSIRQAAFHHQFDVELGTSLWIVTKGNLQIRDRIEEMTGQKGRLEDRNVQTLHDCFKFSLKVHLLCCNWSTEEWRWYIQWLEEVIDEDVSSAPKTPFCSRILTSHHRRIWPKTHPVKMLELGEYIDQTTSKKCRTTKTRQTRQR
jgi:hypothetical protein